MHPRDKKIYLAAIILFLGLFNVLDYFFTLRALAAGLEEANPLMRALVDTPWFDFVKLLLVPALLSIAWRVRTHLGSAAVWSLVGALMLYGYTILHHGRLIVAGIVPLFPL